MASGGPPGPNRSGETCRQHGVCVHVRRLAWHRPCGHGMSESGDGERHMVQAMQHVGPDTKLAPSAWGDGWTPVVHARQQASAWHMERELLSRPRKFRSWKRRRSWRPLVHCRACHRLPVACQLLPPARLACRSGGSALAHRWGGGATQAAAAAPDWGIPCRCDGLGALPACACLQVPQCTA